MYFSMQILFSSTFQESPPSSYTFQKAALTQTSLHSPKKIRAIENLPVLIFVFFFTQIEENLKII